MDAENVRTLKRVVKRYQKSGETIPVEYVRLCQEAGVSLDPKPAPAPAKKAPAKKKAAKRAAKKK